MKKSCIILLLFLLGCATPNIYINPEIKEENIKRIAVIPFDSPDEGGNAGRFMGQLIAIYLLSLDGVIVIPEEEVKMALKETGSSLEAGRMLQADGILTGVIGEYGYRPGADYYQEKEIEKERKITTTKEGTPIKEEEKSKEVATSKKSQQSTIALTVKLTSVQSGQILWAYNLTTNQFYLGDNTLGKTAEDMAKRIASRLLNDLNK